MTEQTNDTMARLDSGAVDRSRHPEAYKYLKYVYDSAYKAAKAEAEKILAERDQKPMSC